MATFNKINSFVELLAEKAFNLGSDQLKVALTNTAHNAAWTQLSDLTQISYTNLSGVNPLNLTTTSSSQTGGLYSLVLADLTLTATDTVGPFRYVYIYSDTSTDDKLIGYYDFGSSLTLETGDTFKIDFGATTLTLQ
jgi:hypothetical protein